MLASELGDEFFYDKNDEFIIAFAKNETTGALPILNLKDMFPEIKESHEDGFTGPYGTVLLDMVTGYTLAVVDIVETKERTWELVDLLLKRFDIIVAVVNKQNGSFQLRKSVETEDFVLIHRFVKDTIDEMVSDKIDDIGYFKYRGKNG